jgi:hypothetical protein
MTDRRQRFRKYRIERIAIRELSIRPHGLNDLKRKPISRVAAWRDTLEKGTVRSQTFFGSSRRLGATDDGAFGRP